MKHIDSLTRLRLKTVGGYVSLMALFIIASVIVVCKSGNLEENSKRYSENIDRRALSEGAFLQLFDLTQLGGQAAILDSTKIAAYEKKEKRVMMTLDSMIMTIPDTAQVRRVKEIKQLVSEKKANAKTEAENQQALNRARQQTDRILTSFASDIQQTFPKKRGKSVWLHRNHAPFLR